MAPTPLDRRVPAAGNALAIRRPVGESFRGPATRRSWVRLVPMAYGLLLLLFVVGRAVAQNPAPDEKPKDGDRKLGERLVREAAGGGTDDPMDTMVEWMDRVARKLEVDFDAGAETQKLQRRILTELDAAIKTAAAQRRPVRSRSRSSQSDKRRMADGESRRGKRSSGSEAGSETAAAAAGGGRGTVSAARGAAGSLLETRRTWGHLPQRQRDELIQGIEERFIERYREWIERYYRALQETEK